MPKTPLALMLFSLLLCVAALFLFRAGGEGDVRTADLLLGMSIGTGLAVVFMRAAPPEAR